MHGEVRVFGLGLFVRKPMTGKNTRPSNKMLKIHQKQKNLMDHGGSI
jgi:hypothetical protein